MDFDNAPSSGNGHNRPAGYLPGPGGSRSPAQNQYAFDEPRIELRDYLRIVMKRRRIIIFTFLGVLVSASAYVFTAPRIYRATAKVQVIQPQPSPFDLRDTKAEEVNLKTQAKYVYSSLVLDDTYARLKASGHPVRETDIGSGLSVNMEEPDVLAICVEHTDPRTATLVANEIEKSYYDHSKQVAREEAKSARLFLEAQEPVFLAELQRSEKQIQAFKAKNRIIDNDPATEAKLSVALAHLTEADRAKSEMDAADAQLNVLKLQLARMPTTRDRPQFFDDPMVKSYQQRVADLKVAVEQARGSYAADHPRVKVLQEQLDEAQRQLTEKYGTNPAPVTSHTLTEPNPAYEMMQAQVQQAESHVAEMRARWTLAAAGAQKAQGDVPVDSPQRVQLDRLVHAKDVAEKTYLEIIAQLNAAKLREAQTIGNVRIIDVATEPRVPVSPQPGRTLALAIIVGLAAGISLALLQEHADTSVHDPDELMMRTGIPSIGFIPAARDPGVNVKIAARSPKSPIAEGFRSIRSNLKFAHLDNPLRTLMVTSSGSGEGKSFTATNLAIVFAQAGIKTVLVDSDLRRPTLHRTFGFDHSPGLTNILAGDVSLQEALHPSGITNLEILCAGTVPPNPSELLDSQRMTGLIAELKDYAEVVIFDTPPALVVTDATVLASRMDCCILVVEQGKVSARALEEIKHLIEQARGKIAGAVINKVKAGAGDYYYYYYYYRYYYYYGERDGGKAGSRRHRRQLPDAGEEPATALPASGAADDIDSDSGSAEA